MGGLDVTEKSSLLCSTVKETALAKGFCFNMSLQKNEAAWKA